MELNEADLDIVQVGCWCDNKFDLPWDAIMFLNSGGMHCGQCECNGTFEVIADPSPNKEKQSGQIR